MMKTRVMLPGIEVTPAELSKLGEYSRSIPTGTAIGKKWRCNRNVLERDRPAEWWMGEYIDIGSKTHVGIRWRPLTIKEKS